MGLKMLLVCILVSMLVLEAFGDLPSCYRARCTHCNVVFIAQMCPNICASCYGGEHTPTGPRIRAGHGSYKPQHQGQGTANRVHGQPIATQHQNQPLAGQSTARHGLLSSSLPTQEAANRAPVAQSLPEGEQHHSNGAPVHQVSANTGGLPQYASVSSQPGFPAPQVNNIGQTTGYGSSYAPAAALPQQYVQQPAPQTFFGQPQPQQSITFFGQQQTGQTGVWQQPSAAQQPQVYGQAQNFGQQTQALQPNSQLPVGQTQAQQSTAFANPFQPFLQQSVMAQQPFLQPFTIAPPPTPAPAPIPPSLPTFPAQQPSQIPPSPNTQYAYLPAQQPNLPAPGVDLSLQRPKQIYNNGVGVNPQAPVARAQEVVAPVAPTSAPLAPSPTRYVAPLPPASNSIDPAPTFVNKNGYAEKNGGAYAQSGTCPKQPNWEPCITKEVANQRFRNCCERLGEGCAQLCSYDQTLAVLQLSVLTGRCPIGKVADMMICASGYEDATACCQAHNVFEMGFEHCRPYCNPAGGLPQGGMLSEKYRCLGKLSQIQKCFYVSQKP